MKKSVLFASALLFVLTLLLSAPATLLPGLINGSGVRVGALNVYGTLWRGGLSQVELVIGNDRHYIENIEWSLSPWSLALGRVCINIIESRIEQITLKGEVCSDVAGNIVASNLDISTTVENALRLAKFPLPVDGKAVAKIASLNWSQSNGMTVLQGQVSINDYAYRVSGKREVLGDYVLEIGTPVSSMVSMAFQPSKAKIELGGEVSVYLSGHEKAGTYQADIQFIPQPSASSALIDSLKFVAAQEPSGNYRFKYNGRF